MANSVLKVLSAIALALTITGIFSVVAYTVDRRLGEFGVRMTLGATQGDIVRLVMLRGGLLAFVGILLGVAGSLALTRSLKSLLYETSPQSPLVLISVGALLLVTSALGCLIPALRATKVDITRLLRSE
jgi:putative ABC transport system permease protein